MTSWNDRKLGEVIQLKRGYDLPSTVRRPGIVPVVSSSGRSGYHDVWKVKGPGVVTGRYGTLGKAYYIEEDFWPLNTALYVSEFNGNDPRFIATLLETLRFSDRNGAAAVPGVNRNHLHEIIVHVPNTDIQRRIGEFSKAIDDLRANIELRIRLLDQIQEAYYEEMFVRFSSSHEQSDLVDSTAGPLPSGWEATTVRDLLVLNYGRALKEERRNGGIVPVVGSSGIVGWHDQSLVSGRTIVVGRKGNVGSLTWLSEASWPIDTTYWVSTTYPLEFIHQMLRRLNFINSHAAVPGLSRDHVYAIPVIRPPDAQIQAYAANVCASRAQQDALGASLRKLESIRDLVLPKLVSGEIDVSELDLDALLAESAA